jgi:hypothetical protein
MAAADARAIICKARHEADDLARRAPISRGLSGTIPYCYMAVTYASPSLSFYRRLKLMRCYPTLATCLPIALGPSDDIS